MLFGSGERLKGRRCCVRVVLEVWTLFRICDCFPEISHLQKMIVFEVTVSVRSPYVSCLCKRSLVFALRSVWASSVATGDVQLWSSGPLALSAHEFSEN